MAKKRSQETSPSSAESPTHKKMKTIASTLDQSVEQDGEGWTKVEKRKQKKTKKAAVKADTTQPRFMYCSAEIIKRNHAIGIDEIRDLIIHIIADSPPPNWLRVDNAQFIQRVVALWIPGLTPDILSLPPFPSTATSNPNLPLAIPLPPMPSDDISSPNIPFIASTFSHACPTRAPGDQMRMHSVLSTFFQGPVTNEEKKRRLVQKLILENNRDKDPAQYLLTKEQMIENEYPIPSYIADVFEKPDGWVETPEPIKPSLLDPPVKDGNLPTQKVYAIDCEMCLTEDGKELTRVCIVDFHSDKVIYDQLVKPSKPIVDYLTRWSGITAAALAPVTTTHAEVQAHVLRLLSPPPTNPFSTSPSTTRTNPAPTPILLGHSLESDLKALKISHPLCIDTALTYHHPRGRPLKPGLAWLTKKWIGREIQTRGEGGHDPEEDARACVDLLRKKIEGGPGFGEFKTDLESIFERLARSGRRAGGGAGSIKSAVVDHGNPAVMHGNKASTAVGCASDEEVLKGLLDVVPSHHFAFGRFMALADLFGWTTPKTTPDAPPPAPIPPPSPSTLTSVLSNLNTHLKTLHSALPERTALIIFTGHSDPRRMAALNARKTAFEGALRSGKSPEEAGADGGRWTAGDGRDLEEAVELAKRGLLFLGIKQGL